MKKVSAYGLYSVALAILVSLGLLPPLGNQINDGYTYMQKRSAANHIEKVNKAFSEYIKMHHADLLETATQTKGPTVTIQDLKNDNLLPEGFSEYNVWRQSYNLYVRKPKDNELQGIVLTDSSGNYDKKFVGTTIPGTATMLGGSGGFIPSGIIPNQTSNKIIGSYGSWEYNLNDLGIASPGEGHLAALATFGSNELGLDFLYRVAVPGEPELNAMQTNLDMTDHDINEVRSIKLVTHTIDDFMCEETDNQGRVFYDELEGMYICRDGKAVMVNDTGNSIMMKNATLASNEDLIDKPLCPAGTDTQPYIFLSPSIVSSGEEALHLASFQTWATDFSSTQWQVHLRVLNKKEEWIYPEPNYNKIMVMTVCGTPTTEDTNP